MTEHDEPAPTPNDDAKRPAQRPAHTHEVLWRVDKDADEWDLPARFDLQRDLGDGPVGPLFLVRDLDHARRLVRLEIVSSGHASRAVDRDDIASQLRAVAAVDAPHVARPLDVGRLADGRVFALYEHADGDSLASRLAREGALHPSHALEITRQVLLALEALHGAGIDHGALTPRCIWLESHAPKSDADPFGVRVRVLAAGMALRSAERGLKRDLRSVGEILALALGPAQGSGVLESSARSLARAMQDDVERPLSHAESARRAVEQTLARARAAAAAPAPSDPYGLKRIGVAAAGAAVVLLGWIAWNVRTDAEAATRAADSERARFLDTQNDLLARVHTLRAELADGESTLKQRLEEFEDALRASGDVVRQAPAVDDAARAELEAQRNAVARLSSELEGKNAELQSAQARLAETLALSERSVRSARGFDALLDLLEAHDADRAAARARVLEAEGLLGSSTDFASALSDSYAQLERFESSLDGEAIDLTAVDSAADSFARARSQRAAFESEAAEWLGLALANASTTPRGERLERVVERIGDRLRGADAQRELAHQREWESLQAQPALAGPERALEHSARFGCRHVDEAGARYVHALVADVVLGEVIDVEPLSRAASSEAWLARVRGGEVRLASELSRDLELLAAARRWYGSGDTREARPDLGVLAAGRDDERTGTWRDQLLLQWTLAGAESSLALEVGRTAWRVDVDPSGAVEWWRDVVENDEGDVRNVRRTRFSANGETALGEGVLRIEQNDGRARYVGCRANLVELHAAGPDVAVSSTPLPSTLELPAALARSGGERAWLRAEADDDLCLVFSEGDVRRWISPRFGVVREEMRTPRGLAVTQLVAFER